MIDPALQAEIDAMSFDERMELVAYIERTIESESVEISEEKKTVVRSRAAELEADPSIGLTWDELSARLASRWG
jgi:putative addiction module component (TIGR02574 family)